MCLNKRTLQMAGIALALIMILASFITLIPASSAASGGPIINADVDDRILFNHDFENYYVGDNPGVVDPIFSNHVNNVEDFGANFQVIDDGGDKKLLYHKHSVGVSDWYPMLPLPTMYKQWLFEFDFNINSLQSGSSGGTTIRITSGQNAYPGQSLVVAEILLWLTGGVYYMKYFTNASTAVNFAIAANTDYHAAFAIDDYARSINFTLTRGTTVVHSDDYPYYTHYSALYPGGMQSNTPSGIRFITLGGAFGQKIYFDNFKGSVPSKIVDAYPQNMLTLTFDDVPTSTFDVGYPILSELDVIGDVAIIVNRVGTAGYMTWDEYNELYENGWGIVSHSLTHGSLHTMPWTQAKAEVSDSKAYIQENVSTSVVRFVCPGSNWNNSLDWYAKSIGYVTVPYNTPRDALYVSGGVPVSELYINNTLSRNTQGVGYYIEWHSHGVDTAAFNVPPTLLANFINTTLANDIKWVTGDYWTNFRTIHNSLSPTIEEADVGVIVESNSTIPLPLGVKLAHLNLSSDVVVIDTSSDELVESKVIDGELVFWAEPGESYQIMTEDDYASLQMDKAIAPIFAIIPLVIILSVIPMIMGLGRRLK